MLAENEKRIASECGSGGNDDKADVAVRSLPKVWVAVSASKPTLAEVVVPLVAVMRCVPY